MKLIWWKKQRKQLCVECQKCHCRIRCHHAGCNSVNFPGSVYCVDHKCELDGCTNSKSNNSSFCHTHYCNNGHCSQWKNPNQPYCKCCFLHLDRQDQQLKTQLMNLIDE